MKDIITKQVTRQPSESVDLLRAAALHIFMCIIGFTVSRAVILDTLSPFGLIFTAATSATYLPSIAIGTFVGYFIPAVTSSGFRYVAALLAVMAIRLMLSSYKKISENPLFLSLIAAAANGITGAVSFSGAPIDSLKIAAEVLLSFGTVFLVSRAFISCERNVYTLSSDELCCLLTAIAIVLMGMSEFRVFGVSAGFTLSVVLILSAAKYGGTTAGAVSGIVISLSAALTGSFEGGFGVYAFAGMLAGMFASLGKYAQTAAVLASGIIGLSFLQNKVGAAVFIVEIIAGCVLFLLMPRSIGVALGKIFYSYPRPIKKGNRSTAITMRLTLASDALKDVSQTVSQVSRELGRLNAPDFKSVLSLVEQDACAGCKLRLHCWESKKDGTIESIMQMIAEIKNTESKADNEALVDFRGRCIRPERFQQAVERRYSEYASLLAAENRIEEVRSVVSDQFDGVSNMLLELAKDFSDDEQFDNSAAALAAEALKGLGICAEEVSARIDKFGRMMLEIRVKRDDDTVFNRLQIMKMLSLACEREFDIPNINKIGDNVLITVGEHASLKVDIGASQHTAGGGNMCGDSYRYFLDGKGHFVMVLSDGMGTGGRAAVDGAMASGLMARLLKAGFGFDCSLKILNSSMLFKSTDESLATVDIASIDLFTGVTELYKAGAAPTVVRRSGRAGRAESTSLPVGILRDISFDRAGIKLRHNDILLLLSDGVTHAGTDWIRAELESWRDGTAQDLAERICECARRRRQDSHEDDITVLAAIIEKAV